MREHIRTRTLELAEFIIHNGATVRDASKVFGISKSTVHKDVSQRLQHIDHQLFGQVKKILEYNLSIRHLRGGIATQKKYLHKNK